jgi:hypothetical protein
MPPQEIMPFTLRTWLGPVLNGRLPFLVLCFRPLCPDTIVFATGVIGRREGEVRDGGGLVAMTLTGRIQKSNGTSRK